MCGIAGIVAADRLRADEAARLPRMRDVITHRGPDDAGLHADACAALAHRRLSIVDLTAGHQPLANEDGNIWIVFNGEIYNHASLRPELEAAGHRYRTRSDTETIVHAYEQWGDGCVERFRGMFALAVWDAPRRRLLLARDRLGIKPLYWTLAGSRLIFGSEIKAILESGLVTAAPNEDAIPELLSTRYLSGAETLFRGIQRLLPGHTLVFENGAVTTRQWWDIPVGASDRGAALPDDEAVAEFRHRLEEAVRTRLMADVPLGMFLSGGLDSSAIAALMARMIDRPLQTFSVAFEDRAFSELEYSRQVARAIGADAHEIVIGPDDFFSALPRLVWHEDEPIGHPSSVPLYFVSRLAHEHVKFVLTGEGSDELLAGYGKYPRALANWRGGAAWSLAPEPFRTFVANRIVPRLPGRIGRYAARSFLAMPRTPEAMFFDNFAAIGLRRQAALLQPGLAAHATVDAAYGASRACFEAPNGHSTVLDRLLYTDLKTYLVELLMKQDQMSMAASIESRVPFLDHPLVEFAAGLPPRMKLRGFTTKWILREAVKSILPAAILDRPKMGFPVPFGLWARTTHTAILRDVLLDRRTRERGITDARAVAALIDAHAAGATNGSDALWSLLNLELWYRTFIDGGGVQTLGRDCDAAAPTHLDTMRATA
ncbi:MAG TPA: asparagine synthase (glutamine-hydrolyzing) [Vicinamibacterales bacterium]|nr:asparagine synthase (glutamine-hydrolyzing) [Vicinamibacterales bacterium]